MSMYWVYSEEIVRHKFSNCRVALCVKFDRNEVFKWAFNHSLENKETLVIRSVSLKYTYVVENGVIRKIVKSEVYA